MIKHWMYYVTALAVAVTLVALMPHRVTVALLAALIIAPVLSLLLLVCAYASFTCGYQTEIPSAVRGHAATMTVKARCRFFLSFSYLYVYTYGQQQPYVIAADARSRIVLDVPVPCDAIGIKPAGIRWVRMQDMLGLFCLNKTMPPKMVRIYPDVFAVEQVSLNGGSVNEISTDARSLQKDNILVSSIRDYQTDDTLRSVHWKLSSKMNKLMVKNHENIARMGLNVLTNLHSTDEACIDRILECAVSLVRHSMKEQRSANVCLSNRCVAVGSESQWDRLMDHIVHIKGSPIADLQESVSVFLKHNPSPCPVVLITARRDAEIARIVDGLDRLGYPTAVLAVGEQGVPKNGPCIISL